MKICGTTHSAHGTPSPGPQGTPIVFDPVGDFLSVYAAPASGDLDVVVSGAFLSGLDEVVLSGTHAGLIGTTPGAVYVWASTAAPAPTFSPCSTRPRA